MSKVLDGCVKTILSNTIVVGMVMVVVVVHIGSPRAPTQLTSLFIATCTLYCWLVLAGWEGCAGASVGAT